MSFIQALEWWQWLILAAIPPAIIALYFLKLRRQPLEVPSTYLWSRTIEDLHVNSIWQRLRQSLLLLLQLLLIALVIMACLRPGWRGTELTGNRFIFLIDTSASMSATDVAPTRLEKAKRQVLEYIGQMKAGDAAMVISSNNGAKVEQAFTRNVRLLRQRVRRIQPSNRSTNLDEALQYAAGLANPSHTRLDAAGDPIDESIPATMYIFSDGGFRIDPEFGPGNLEMNYIPVGSKAPENVSVAAFRTERNAENPGQTQAFARLENFGPQEVKVDITLHVDDNLRDVRGVVLPAAGEGGPGVAGVEFEIQDIQDAVLRVELDYEDQLALDNVAYAAVNTPRRAEILLVTPSNEALRRALNTEHARRLANVTVQGPESLPTEDHLKQADAGLFDLIIYDQCAPQRMPQANTLFFGALPPLDGWSAGDAKELPQVIDTDRLHPLMQLIDVSRLLILDAFPVEAPAGASTLIDADFGPLFAIAPRQGFEDAVLGMRLFSIKEGAAEEIEPNTDWPMRRSFPVFVFNVIRYLGGSRGALGDAVVQPGQPMVLRTHLPVPRATVQSPSGSRLSLNREGQNTFVYPRTDELGVYDVWEGNAADVSQRFAVNLFDSRESDLAMKPVLDFGTEQVTGQVGLESTRRELWKWILIVGLVVLVAEWYIYNRRVYL